MEPLNPQAQAQQPQSQPAYSTPPASQAPERKKTGPMIAILVVVLILIIGALYLFTSGTTEQSPADNTLAGDNNTTESVQPVTNTSDDVSDLEADLNASVDGLDAQNF
jgi:uncharacterized protein HemX